MKKIGIMTDSHSGILTEEAEKLGIKVLPMPFYIDDELYLEGVDLSREEFYEKLCQGVNVSTSQPSPQEVMETWDDMLKEYETLIYIPISSGLSGSCMTAQGLAQDEEYEGKVFVVDNGHVSTPLHRSVLDAVEMAEAGYSAVEIKKILEETKEQMVIYVGLSTLEYLKKGGRISSTSALLANVLNIKPVMKFGTGVLDVYQKCRGMKKSRKAMIDAMKNELAKYEKELSGKPIGEASIDLQIKIDNLKNQIEGVKIWIEKEAFKDTHGEIKVDVIPSSSAGRNLGQMAEDFQDKRSKKNPDSEQKILTHDAIKKMKLPKIEMPKIDPKKSGFEKWNEAVDTAYKKNQDFIEGMSGIGSVMGSLGQAVGGAAGEWLNWAANVVQAVAAAIPQITSLLGLQSTQVAANTAVAGSGAAASTASIPIVGPILAVAAVASVLAALANLPKFANGAIAYGPTMGLFGEYSGAQNNPEVVAPLNKLRQLIQPAGGMGGIVEFRIDGRMLRGVLNKVDRYNQRTR